MVIWIPVSFSSKMIVTIEKIKNKSIKPWINILIPVKYHWHVFVWISSTNTCTHITVLFASNCIHIYPPKGESNCTAPRVDSTKVHLNIIREITVSSSREIVHWQITCTGMHLLNKKSEGKYTKLDADSKGRQMHTTIVPNQPFG